MSSFRISGRNIDIGEALRTRINERIAEATAKYFDGGFSGHVTVGKEGFGFRTECMIHLDSGIILEADAMAADAYASADQVAGRIEKRLRRYKRRLKNHQAAGADGELPEQRAIEAPSYIIAAPEHDDDGTAEFNPVIIAESTTALKRLSVSEALGLDIAADEVGVIKGSAEILNQKLAGSDSLSQELSGYIYTEVNRVSALVSRFLDFARPSRLDLRASDLARVVERCLKTISEQGGCARVTVQRDFASELPKVMMRTSVNAHCSRKLTA